jgi:hypothetical protein
VFDEEVSHLFQELAASDSHSVRWQAGADQTQTPPVEMSLIKWSLRWKRTVGGAFGMAGGSLLFVLLIIFRRHCDVLGFSTS